MSPPTSFNALHDPWLPVVDRDGEPTTVSPAVALAEAHRLQGLRAPTGHGDVALLRFLIALWLATRSDDYRSADAAALLGAGRFEAEAIETYADRFRGFFELFDPDHPFLQSPDPLYDVAPSPISRLVPELASGNNATLFDHSLDGAPPAVDAATALVWLLVHQAYALGGGVSRPFNLTDGPLARGVAVVPVGSTLFETIVLATPPYHGDRQPIPRLGHDRPTWEGGSAPPDRAGTPVQGFRHLLSWRSRDIRLIVEDDGLVRRCRYQQGHRLPDGVRDPFMGYRHDEKTGRWLVARAGADRALWRDSATLLAQFRRGVQGDASVLDHVDHLAAVLAASGLPMPSYRLHAAGLVTAQAKVAMARDERLPLGPALVGNERLRDVLAWLLDDAEAGHSALRKGAWKLAELLLSPSSDRPGGRTPDRGDVEALVTSFRLAEDYWPRLERDFAAACRRLEGGDDPASVVDTWRVRVRAHARGAFDRLAATRSLTGRSDHAVARASQRFGGVLHELLPEPMITTTPEVTA